MSEEEIETTKNVKSIKTAMMSIVLPLPKSYKGEGHTDESVMRIYYDNSGLKSAFVETPRGKDERGNNITPFNEEITHSKYAKSITLHDATFSKEALDNLVEKDIQPLKLIQLLQDKNNADDVIEGINNKVAFEKLYNFIGRNASADGKVLVLSTLNAKIDFANTLRDIFKDANLDFALLSLSYISKELGEDRTLSLRAVNEVVKDILTAEKDIELKDVLSIKIPAGYSIAEHMQTLIPAIKRSVNENATKDDELIIKDLNEKNPDKLASFTIYVKDMIEKAKQNKTTLGVPIVESTKINSVSTTTVLEEAKKVKESNVSMEQLKDYLDGKFSEVQEEQAQTNSRLDGIVNILAKLFAKQVISTDKELEGLLCEMYEDIEANKLDKALVKKDKILAKIKDSKDFIALNFLDPHSNILPQNSKAIVLKQQDNYTKLEKMLEEIGEDVVAVGEQTNVIIEQGNTISKQVNTSIDQGNDLGTLLNRRGKENNSIKQNIKSLEGLIGNMTRSQKDIQSSINGMGQTQREMKQAQSNANVRQLAQSGVRF